MEYEGVSETKSIWYAWKELGKEPERIRNQRRNLTLLRPQQCWDQLENWEESWRFEETCSHSDSNERRTAYIGMKNNCKELKTIDNLVSGCPIQIPIEYKESHETKTQMKDLQYYQVGSNCKQGNV